MPNSFIDSGSGSLFFNDNNLTACSSTGVAAGYYCPGNKTSVSAVAISAAIASAPNLNLTLGNAEYLFNENNGIDAVFNNIGSPAGTVLPNSFDFGMPFFFGRSVYTGFEQKTHKGLSSHFKPTPEDDLDETGNPRRNENTAITQLCVELPFMANGSCLL
jgi:hypothetical protein